MSLVVKAYHPWRSRLVNILLLVVALLAAWALFEYGRYSAGFDSFKAREQHDVLLKRAEVLQRQIDSLREEKAVLERDAQIKHQAYGELDTTLKVLQGEILELKEELAFYRGIVSPRDAAQGLHLQRFKVEPNGKPRGFRYKVILTQVLKEDRTARGYLLLAFEGMQGADAKVLSLQDVSEKHIKEEDFSFRYFQNIEGDIQLPQGFKPQRVTIKVVSRNRSSQDPLEKTFDWPERK
ncbi:MAG: hypothetical protein GC149_07010 [Gammaproteobacteria bacterium]|nr:hypothetical protein [Gammaproteobacteria bacterium]